MSRASFPKREHLCSTRLIDELFGSGSQSMAAFPMRAVFKTTGRTHGGAPVQLLISVPKKRFKHAVDRNRVKRQVREAYRRLKEPLCQSVASDRCLLLGIVWISDSLAPSAVVDSRMQRLLSRIAEKL